MYIQLAIIIITTLVIGSIALIADKYTNFINKYGLIIKKYFFLTGIMGVAYFVTFKFNDSDWDLWARFAVGKIFCQIGNVLPHDIFAYTVTKQFWVDHEWGSGVIFYYLAHNFGDIGLFALKFLILFGIAMFVFSTNQLRGNEEKPYRLSYYILLFYAIWPAFDNVIRSHAFTYLFFAIWLYALEQVRKGQNKYMWLFPAVMLIWANTHGGFLAGLGITILFAIGELINRRNPLKYLLVLAISGIVTLINPYGFKYWGYIINAASMPRPFITEWAPLNFFGYFWQVLGFKIFAVLTLISLIYIVIKRFREINWSDILILAVTFYMSLQHIRHIIFFSIAAASYIYYWLYPAINWFTFDIANRIGYVCPLMLKKVVRVYKETLIGLLIFVFCFSILIILPRKIIVNEYRFPARAVKFIQINHLSGNLLILFNWGSYALWKLYPQCLVAVDGRYEEVYPESHINDIARFHYAGVNWDGLIKKYHTDLMLIPVAYNDIYNNVSKLPDWKLVYQDKMAAVFVPKSIRSKKWKKVPTNFNPDNEKYLSDIKVNPNILNNNQRK